MRPVAIGDVVTWGNGSLGYRVVRIVETGVYVDGLYQHVDVFFIPWGGDGRGRIRHLCGDRVDYLASFDQRLS